jgi:hypothetical protein
MKSYNEPVSPSMIRRRSLLASANQREVPQGQRESVEGLQSTMKSLASLSFVFPIINQLKGYSWAFFFQDFQSALSGISC